jgi:hypothetical protein
MTDAAAMSQKTGMKVAKTYYVDIDLLGKVREYAGENHDGNLSAAVEELAKLGYEDHKRRGKWSVA